MPQVLQLPEGGDQLRSFRDLGPVTDAERKKSLIKPDIHQMYDLIWRRIECARVGGAINADEPELERYGHSPLIGSIKLIPRLEHCVVRIKTR